MSTLALYTMSPGQVRTEHPWLWEIFTKHSDGRSVLHSTVVISKLSQFHMKKMPAGLRTPEGPKYCTVVCYLKEIQIVL